MYIQTFYITYQHQALKTGKDIETWPQISKTLLTVSQGMTSRECALGMRKP